MPPRPAVLLRDIHPAEVVRDDHARVKEQQRMATRRSDAGVLRVPVRELLLVSEVLEVRGDAAFDMRTTFDDLSTQT